MKIILTCCFVILFCFFSQSQNNLALSRQVISSFNLSSTAPNGIYLSMSAGQPAFTQETSSMNFLHQGFEQADNQWCPGDYNNNGVIDVGDVLLMLPIFGCYNGCDDMNQDGLFNILDLLVFMSLMGTVCNI